MYRNYSTAYAFVLLQEQLTKHESTDIVTDGDDFKSHDKRHSVAVNSCSCGFHRQYGLPCRHIFALRVKLGEELFDETLVPVRWTRRHYLRTFDRYLATGNITQSVQSPRLKPQSQQQRYRSAYHVAQRLASRAAEGTGAIFEARMGQMNALLQAWEHDQIVSVECHDATGVQEAELPPIRVETTHDPVDENVDESSVLLHSTETSGSKSCQLYQRKPQTNQFHTNLMRNEDKETSAGDNQTKTGGNLTIEESSVGSSQHHLIPGGPMQTSETATEAPAPPIQEPPSVEPQTSIEEIRNITVPPNIKKRGRPKGSELTVIGITKKRLKLKRPRKPFSELSDTVREKMMLGWFLEDSVIRRCMSESGEVAEEEAVECRPEELFLAATEVELTPIRKYFSPDAWMAVESVVSSAKDRSWVCNVCAEPLDTRCVGCDLCLGWLHFHCAAISDPPRTKNWYCRQCLST